MAILLGWTPARLVKEHEKDVPLLLRIDLDQWLVQVGELKEALRHKVVLDTLVLKVSVHGFDQL